MSRGIIADTTPSPPTSFPALHPHVHVIALTRNRIRIGSGPAGSLELIVADDIDIDRMCALLGWMRVRRRRDDIIRRARTVGLTRRDITGVVHALIGAGLTEDPPHPVGDATAGTLRQHEPRQHETRRPVRVSIEGRGPLTTRLRAHLPGVSIAVTGFDDANLTILADHLVPDPHVVDTLMRRGRAHLQVRMRDGAGLIGPLVLPGRTSCLRCADHHRTTVEPQWPVIAAGLVGRTSDAALAQIRATAALAQWQIEELADAVASIAHGRARPGPPQLVDHVLELHPGPTRFELRHWTPHPLCGCREASAAY